MTTLANRLHTDRIFPGLRPFDERDALLFFGRDDQTDSLLRRLDDARFVAVVGLSGSGKSSLVRAGLVPALRRGHLSGAGPRWRIGVMRPGSDPLGALAATLDRNDVLEPLEDRLDLLRVGDLGLVHASRFTRQPEENLLIVVDQFEEIFRFQNEYKARAGEATEFVRLLLSAVRLCEPTYRVYVVVTMRSDYLGECARFSGLPEALNDSQYLVPRMTDDQLREAIQGPSALGGVELEPELVALLLQETGSDPDQLPMLQHLLMRIWDYARADGRSRLTRTEMGAVGGWQGALTEHANQMLETLTDDQRALTKRVFQRLTEPGEANREGRRPASLSELARVAQADKERVTAVVDRFKQEGCNFLTSPDSVLKGDSVIDVTHESLIRRWAVLGEWVKEEADSAAWYRRVQDSNGLHERGEKGLMADAELTSALDARSKGEWNAAWAARYVQGAHQRANGRRSDSTELVFAKAMAYLDKSKRTQDESKRAHQRSQKTRYALAAVLLGVLAAAIAAYFINRREVLFLERSQAIRQEPDPLKQALALAEIAGSRFDALSAVVAAAPIPLAVLRGRDDDGALIGATFADSNRVVLTISATGVLTRWSSDGRGDPQTIVMPRGIADPSVNSEASDPSDPLTAAAFSDDGAWVAAGFKDGSAWLGRSDGSGRWTEFGTGDPNRQITALAFNPGGTLIIAGYNDYGLQIWNRDGTPGLTVGTSVESTHRGAIRGVAFDAAGMRLASASFDGTTRVWGLDSPEKPLLVLGEDLGEPGSVPSSVAFSPNGNWVVTGYEDGARIWRTDRKEAAIKLGNADTKVRGARFNPADPGLDPTMVVVVHDDGRTRVWRIPAVKVPSEPGTPPWTSMTLEGHDGPVNTIAFSTDGARIVSVSNDRTARIWSADEPGLLGKHRGRVESVAFSPQGDVVLSASDDKSAIRWTVGGRSSKKVVAEHQDWVRSAVFSPDGSLVATASEDRTWVLRRLSDQERLAEGKEKSPVLSIGFDRSGGRVVTSQEDNTAKVWSVKTNELLRVLAGHEGWVFSARFNQDGTRIVSASRDRTARVWSADSGDMQITLGGHADTVFSASFSPDGSRIVTASADRTARIWNAHDAGVLHLLRHDASVNHAEFNSDGTQVLTASDDGTVRVWRVADGTQAFAMRFDARMRTASFSPANDHVVTGDEHGRVRLLPLTSGGLVLTTTACLPADARSQMLRESTRIAQTRYLDCERGYQRTVQSVSSGR